MCFIRVLGLVLGKSKTFRVSQFHLYRIPSVSGFHHRFAFSCLKKVIINQLFKTSEWQFYKWILGLQKFFGNAKKLAPVVRVIVNRALRDL